MKSIKVIIVIVVIIYSYILFILMQNDTIRDIILEELSSKYKESLDSSVLVFNSINDKYYTDFKYVEELYDIEVPKNIKEVNNPLIYIYNTHQTEEYDKNNVSHSIKPNVFYASFILKDYLNDLGVSSIVETSSIKKYLIKNKLSYGGSYQASRYYLKEKLNKNTTVKYIIDLHRDSASKKITTVTKNNKKYARVLFVVGMKNKNHKKNLEFVNDINKRLNKKVPDISRGLYKRNDVIFNQDLCDTAILLELGGLHNTLEEISNTLEIVSIVYYEYIKENSNGKK